MISAVEEGEIDMVSKSKIQVVAVSDYEELSREAARRIIAVVRQHPASVLGLATGSTPEGTYRELVRDHEEHGTSYHQVTTFNLDEYVGLAANDPHSYHTYMDQHLFRHLDIPQGNTHLPDGSAEKPEAECRRYEEMIRQAGGIDLQLLGIGVNGHIGFNEPGTPFSSETQVVQLDESTRQANQIHFEDPQQVPTHAITMGMATILKSRGILLLASGAKKAPVLQRLLTETEITPDLPASILRSHEDVTLIADQEALSLVEADLG